MKKIFFAALLSCLTLGAAQAAEGLVVMESAFSVNKTMDRFVSAVEGAGLKVFARIDHAKGAESVGMSLKPTEVLIFGNPKMGTRLMESNPEIGLDLPLKALVWKGEDGKVRLAYNAPAFLENRYGIHDRPKVIAKMTGALSKFATAATTP